MKFKEPKVSIVDITAFDAPVEFEMAYLSLCAERRERVDLYRKEDDKKRALAASVLLRESLFELGVSDFSIVCGENGKPYLKDSEDIFFSLSHSGNYAVCAIYNKEIGVDVEKISEAQEKLIRKVTTDSEYDFLMSLDEEARNEQFARLWTAKESYVKRDGSGFIIPPTELSVDLSGELSISRNGNRENISFEEITLSGYKLTVCY